ncbi:MAG: hypothetical protein K0S49_2933 [Microbacterium sp.]|nr:hypothetical protein [Microbacterium sp.]
MSLVVDVGHVAHERHTPVTVLEPTAQDVEPDGCPHMTDVRARLHRRTADVDRDVRRVAGREITQRLRAGVVEANGHCTSLPAGRRAAVACARSPTR